MGGLWGDGRYTKSVFRTGSFSETSHTSLMTSWSRKVFWWFFFF